MDRDQESQAVAVTHYLESRPRLGRFGEWMTGRRHIICSLGNRKSPVLVISHKWWEANRVKPLELALCGDWQDVPAACRDAYDEILLRAPKVVVIEWRWTNVCGCLGHRHVFVREPAFAVPHDALGGEPAGELDIASQRIKAWQALPLTDTALDSQFLEGTRAQEFHAAQFRLKLLSVVLHEINHLVFSQEPETSVRERSLAFYREALTAYVHNAIASLSLTIDRSFSRLG